LTAAVNLVRLNSLISIHESQQFSVQHNHETDYVPAEYYLSSNLNLTKHDLAHERKHKHRDVLYSASQKNFIPPKVSSIFSPKSWEFLSKISYFCYAFIFTLNYKSLSNYLQLWQSYAILSTQRPFLRFTWHPSVPTSSQRTTDQTHQTSTHLHTWCNASRISQTLPKAKDHSRAEKCIAADPRWLAAETKLSTTERRRLAGGGRFEQTMWTLYRNILTELFAVS